MDRDELINAFGGAKELAKLMGISFQAVYKWPERLPLRIMDRVIGAAWRHNRVKDLPPIVL
jgi:hypothetical protein